MVDADEASQGLDDERATVAWTIANGGINSGLDVTVFLVSSRVDVVGKGAADLMRMNPLDPPLKELIETFMSKGGKVRVYPPCASVRGYDQEDLLDGVEIKGSLPMHELIKDGARRLSASDARWCSAWVEPPRRRPLPRF